MNSAQQDNKQLSPSGGPDSFKTPSAPDSLQEPSLQQMSSKTPPESTTSHQEEGNNLQASQVSDDYKIPPEIIAKAPSKKKLFFSIFLFSFFLFLITLGGLTLSIAYGKVDLNNPSVERKIEKMVLFFPFMPKTPRYILESSALAHRNVTEHSFNISSAISSNNPLPFYGINSLDIDFNGKVDYSNLKNILASFDASLGNDFGIKVRKKDNFLYFKITKVPTFLSFIFPIDEEKLAPVLENWVVYDTTPLDTEARRYLEEKSPKKSITQAVIEETIQNIFDEKILDAISLSQENLDITPTYKLQLSADEDLIDHLGSRLMEQARKDIAYPNDQEEFKLSEMIKDLEIQAWIDKKDYYLRKVTIFFNVDSGGFYPYYSGSFIPGVTSLGDQKISVSIVVVLNNFGEEVIVEIPSQSITSEEFLKQIGEIYQESVLEPTSEIKCVDSNEQCRGKPDGTQCTYGIWCDEEGKICGGQSCPNLGLGECINEKCELAK